MCIMSSNESSKWASDYLIIESSQSITLVWNLFLDPSEFRIQIRIYGYRIWNLLFLIYINAFYILLCIWNRFCFFKLMLKFGYNIYGLCQIQFWVRIYHYFSPNVTHLHLQLQMLILQTFTTIFILKKKKIVYATLTKVLTLR